MTPITDPRIDVQCLLRANRVKAAVSVCCCHCHFLKLLLFFFVDFYLYPLISVFFFGYLSLCLADCAQ